MNWPPHWGPLEDSISLTLVAALKRELKVSHPLYGVPVTAIGRRDNQDDVLFQVLDGTGRVAVVHLTFHGELAIPPCPWTDFGKDFNAWATSVGENGDFLQETS